MPIEHESLSEVYKGMEATRSLIQELHNKYSVSMSRIEEAFARLKEDSNQLLEIVRDGNGKESLLIRVSRVEDSITRVSTQMTLLMAKMDELNDSASARATQKIKLRWEFWAIVVGALLASMSSIVVAIIK